MKDLKRRFSAVPGAATLFFIQIFATLGFAVLYSTLVLYATRHLQLPVKLATALMGVFGAFNYGLHLFGGYLGGRFLSNRNLFVGGMALQVIGCACIATGTLALFERMLGFNDYVLEMTPAVLERLEKGLVAEAAERKAAQRILARMRDKPAYDRCMQELVASPEGKKAYDAMFPPGGQVNQQAAADMQKLQNAKCGPDPNTYGTVENELRNKPSKAGEAASGFQYRQYAILKERVVPFCSLGPSADGGVFQIKQGGGFLVYSTQEVMALGPRCAKLKFALQGVV